MRHVAHQLREVIRAQDYAARIGDNRFALVLPGVMNIGHAELAVQKLFRLLEVPFRGEQATVRMTATVGVAVSPMHASQAEFLLRQAEKSLELARNTGQRWLFPPEAEEDRRYSEFWDLEIELDGAVQYRVIAYRTAAKTVRESAVSVEQLVRDGRVTELPGIGKTLEEKLQILIDTGDMKQSKKLREQFPSGLIAMMHLPGFGPKRARRLYDELGIDSLEKLRAYSAVPFDRNDAPSTTNERLCIDDGCSTNAGAFALPPVALSANGVH